MSRLLLRILLTAFVLSASPSLADESFDATTALDAVEREIARIEKADQALNEAIDHLNDAVREDVQLIPVIGDRIRQLEVKYTSPSASLALRSLESRVRSTLLKSAVTRHRNRARLLLTTQNGKKRGPKFRVQKEKGAIAKSETRTYTVIWSGLERIAPRRAFTAKTASSR